MNITKFDIGITISMLIAIISMNFMIPALGLADVNESEGDIPEFNISTDRFDFAGEFPRDVDRKELSGGTINISNLTTENFVYKLPKDGQLAGFNESDNFASPTWRVRLAEWGGVIQYDEQNVSIGEKFFLNDTANYQVTGEFYRSDEGHKIIEYRVIEGATDNYSGLIGGIYRLTDILYWGIGTFITIFANGFAIIYDVVTFILGIFGWFIGTYSTITANANGWVPLILAIPGVLLFAEMAKITAVIIDILWIG